MQICSLVVERVQVGGRWPRQVPAKIIIAFETGSSCDFTTFYIRHPDVLPNCYNYRINGITPEVLQERGEPEDEVMTLIQELLRGKRIIATTNEDIHDLGLDKYGFDCVILQDFYTSGNQQPISLQRLYYHFTGKPLFTSRRDPNFEAKFKITLYYHMLGMRVSGKEPPFNDMADYPKQLPILPPSEN